MGKSGALPNQINASSSFLVAQYFFSALSVLYFHRLPPAHGHQLLVTEQLLGHLHWHLHQGWSYFGEPSDKPPVVAMKLSLGTTSVLLHLRESPSQQCTVSLSQLLYQTLQAPNNVSSLKGHLLGFTFNPACHSLVSTSDASLVRWSSTVVLKIIMSSR